MVPISANSRLNNNSLHNRCVSSKRMQTASRLLSSNCSVLLCTSSVWSLSRILLRPVGVQQSKQPTGNHSGVADQLLTDSRQQRLLAYWLLIAGTEPFFARLNHFLHFRLDKSTIILLVESTRVGGFIVNTRFLRGTDCGQFVQVTIATFTDRSSFAQSTAIVVSRRSSQEQYAENLHTEYSWIV